MHTVPAHPIMTTVGCLLNAYRCLIYPWKGHGMVPGHKVTKNRCSLSYFVYHSYKVGKPMFMYDCVCVICLCHMPQESPKKGDFKKTKAFWPTPLTSYPAQNSVMNTKWHKMIPNPKFPQNSCFQVWKCLYFWKDHHKQTFEPKYGLPPHFGPRSHWRLTLNPCDELITIF